MLAEASGVKKIIIACGRTELPKFCDEEGNIDTAKLDHLLPWAEELPDECRKPRR